ncbi:MAG: nucleotidyltransferase domain-containing protein [Deltaproteobacteria bacterium]|nr:nucleotidyltransferase domain-containing protein [Deltaproteobacteria bacterium]
MAIPKTILKAHPSLDEWAVLSAYRGSIAHGMYVPSSNPDSIDDRDVMAVCIPPLDFYFGLKEFGSGGTEEIKQDEWDIVVYEVRKFIRLLARGNPNVLMMLWLDPPDYLKVSEAGQLLLDNRHLFVGRHVYQAFIGYARSQLHKMTHFGFQGYMGTKRKKLVERFGYDCKNAAHLIRLLRMGIEFLRCGQLLVRRPDAEELLGIKRGEWTLEQVQTEAEKGFRKAEEAYSASSLPHGPDMERINKLAIEVVQMGLDGRVNIEKG